MSLLFADSFDHYSTLSQKWELPGSNVGAIAASGRTGSKWSDISDDRQGAGKVVGNLETVIVGFALYVGAWNTSNSLVIHTRDGATFQISLYLEATTHKLLALRGATLLGTSTNALTLAAWAYIEIKAKCHATDGGVHVRVNGVDEIKLGAFADTPAALDTTETANNYVTSVYMRVTGGGDRRSVCGNFQYDDLYICDTAGTVNNNFLGDVTVGVILPNGTGAYSDFTPSAGSNFQNVDEAVGDGDTTYNQSITVGHADSYVYGDLPANVAVYGVQTIPSLRKASSGFRRLRSTTRIGTTDYDISGDIAVGDSYAIYRTISETSPATSAAWTDSEVNAAEFGVRISS